MDFSFFANGFFIIVAGVVLYRATYDIS